MTYQDIRYYTSDGVGLSLCYLWTSKKCSVTDIWDAAEDAIDGNDFITRINSLHLLNTFVLDRENDKRVRLKTTDTTGTSCYLELIK